MPEAPQSPVRRPPPRIRHPDAVDGGRPVAELVCRSAFSFQEGASLPEELVEQATALGLRALAITDRDAVYGLPRAWTEARRHGLHLVCGALLTVQDGPGLAALARTPRGWTHLCHLITHARCGGPPDDDAVGPRTRRRARGVVKGRGRVPFSLVLEKAAGIEFIAMGDWSADRLGALRDAAGDHLSLGLVRRLDSHDDARMAARRALARQAGVPLVATADVVMHHPDRQRLQDVLTCIRLHTTVDRAGTALQANAGRHLLSPAEYACRFAGYEDALDRTVEIADRCRFGLDRIRYRYPREVVPEGRTPMEHLRVLVAEGARQHYPRGVPDSVRAQLEHELALIEKLDFPAYFLTVHDAVRFARQRGILCQGRGSAANSAVCYVLGITSVDPASSSLLFERFISEERGEPPDIDVDFEHERREEVFRYLYDKYGRHRAAMINEVIRYRRRSAVRDVGKALGLSLDQVDRMARRIHWFDGEHIGPEQLRDAGMDPADRRVQLTVELTGQLAGLPRHVGIHVGGFAISDDPLIDLCPVEPATKEGRTVIQWDKDDIDVVGFVKVDFLSLGILTAIRKTFDLVARHWRHPLSLATVPAEDPAVYDMICKADTIGVFQIESRAQMSMLPRLKPRCWYDLVIEVSVVRPGPIQGGMVHPYLRRRNGEEPEEYAHEKLRPILERTLGVPIFQEQVMAMAVAVGGFTPGQADELRRAMGAWRKRGGLEKMSEELVAGMMAEGITEDYARQIAAQIRGFGEYGFPESHAASFARLVYVSAWLKHHYPGAFAAALVNSQPMGFYSARTLLADAQRHGVELRPVDVRHSDWDLTLEPAGAGADRPFAIRLGMRMVKGLSSDAARRIEAARRQRPFADIGDLQLRADLSRDDLVRLARADALAGLGPAGRPWNRRQAVWAVQGLYDLPLFRGLSRQEDPAPLPAPDTLDELREDYATMGLSVDMHPIAMVRADLERRSVRSVAQVQDCPPDARVRVAGMISHRQRPGTASGILFMTLEDETGLLNIVVKPHLFERQRRVILEHSLVEIAGRIQRDGDSLSLLAFRFQPLRGAPAVSTRSRDFR
ncbi:MAG: DNA polymerase III subunit alpha [Deltaproteobacteria bacterium]|nr:MAG: DNA polymerase III subunit alpha [Deltaproteobacteria bacterium]